MARIVSLLASATETVCALGFESDLVGRSHECDYPDSVKSLPPLSFPRMRVDGSSIETDRRVKSLLENALSIYRVDAEALRALRPTHVVTQDHCRVCAVSLPDVEAALAEWTREAGGPAPVVVSLSPNSLSDVYAGIRRIASSLAAPRRGEVLVERMKRGMAEIEAEASAIDVRPRVAVIEWIEPLMAAGNWMPELVAMAGGDNLAGEAGKHSPTMTLAELASLDPDVVFVSPCGYGLEKTLQEMEPLSLQPLWASLRAVREGRVFAADGNRFFNRPGPRLVESLQILATALTVRK